MGKITNINFWKILIFLPFLLSVISCKKVKIKNDDKLNDEPSFGKVKMFNCRTFMGAEKFGEYQRADLNREPLKDIEKFNLNGCITERLSFSRYSPGLSQIEMKEVSEYDDKGLLVVKNVYESNGSLFSRHLYKHDSNGNISESNCYKPDGSPWGKEVYVYNENGKVSKRINYPISGEVYNIEFIYDKEMRVIEMRSTSNNTIYSRTLYKYGEFNYVTEEKSYTNENIIRQLYTYKYKFDEKGNWVKKIQFWNDSSNTFYITEREIEYY